MYRRPKILNYLFAENGKHNDLLNALTGAFSKLVNTRQETEIFLNIHVEVKRVIFRKVTHPFPDFNGSIDDIVAVNAVTTSSVL